MVLLNQAQRRYDLFDFDCRIQLTYNDQMATLMFWIELFCVSWNARKLNHGSSNHDE